MSRQLPPHDLGITAQGRKLHVMYPATGYFGFTDGPDRSGCGRKLYRRASEDEKRIMEICTASGCAGVPHK